MLVKEFTKEPPMAQPAILAIPPFCAPPVKVGYSAKPHRHSAFAIGKEYSQKA